MWVRYYNNHTGSDPGMVDSCSESPFQKKPNTRDCVCLSVAGLEKGNQSLTVTGQTNAFFSVELRTTTRANSNEQPVLLVTLHIHRSTGE